MEPQLPSAPQAREGDPIQPGTQVPDADVSELVWGQLALLLLVNAGHLLRVQAVVTGAHEPVMSHARVVGPL